MKLFLNEPQREIDRTIIFIRDTFRQQGIRSGVIAVSGGIDSGLALTLLAKTLGSENICVLQLPYHRQSCTDASIICEWNKIPSTNITKINIGPLVDEIIRTLHIPVSDRMRRGNIMARMRMIVTYDFAKIKRALVCGTENKSEKYLGYFTRFGDSASDIEPLQQWYKTQVRQCARFLHLPKQLIDKAPSAELWENQTDEQELGFTYDQADRVIDAYIGRKTKKEGLKVPGLDQQIVNAVIERIESQKFKNKTPYVREKGV